MRLGYVTMPGRGMVDPLLAGVVARLESEGVPLAGSVQVNGARAGRTACDMDLRLLPDGPVLRISTDRGALARGCRLDAGALELAVPRVQAALPRAALVVVNKFGKQEATGRGFAGVIAEALDRGLPVLVGVNDMNLGAFLDFSGGLAEPVEAEPDAVLAWCHAARVAASGVSAR